MTEAELRDLIAANEADRVAHARTFDALPCLGSRLEDLPQLHFLVEYRSQAIAPEIIEENNRSIEQRLSSLRCFDLSNGCPTNAGILLFGRDIRRFLPGAYVQFLRVKGDSLADLVVNERELGRDLITLMRELDALLDANLVQFPVTESTLRERIIETYPRIAVRELVLNAVLHRDYASTAPVRLTFFDDRVEVQSPGGLYGEASEDNFPNQTSYRNPVIAEAMKVLGYVNRYGRGVLRSQKALADNGSPPAEFRFDPGYVLAIIRARS
jgi:ATP-dependent DNA helicase RecG